MKSGGNGQGEVPFFLWKVYNWEEEEKNDTRPYQSERIHISFPEGMKWARVLATDIAGNSAFGMPVFLKKAAED